MLRTVIFVAATLSLLPVCTAFVKVSPAINGERAKYHVPLRRELVPVIRDGEVISHKTSYSGKVQVGNPSQEFRVVFDTGSAHVIIPSVNCVSETCLMHRRYNASASSIGVPVNADGTRVPEDEMCDQVSIAFGTGTVTGEFVSEKICAGACGNMRVVTAVEMSEDPFKSFSFDGIVGLALESLALSPSFNILNAFHSGQLRQAQFGFSLVTGDQGSEESELMVGGVNHDRVQGRIHWAPVETPEHGHWQVAIRRVRIGNRTIGNCETGKCRAIFDTGTSHVGVPDELFDKVLDLMSVKVDDPKTDCSRLDSSVTMEIEIGDFSVQLNVADYMRQLPISEFVVRDVTGHAEADDEAEETELLCEPRLMPVKLPEPFGNLDVFILGEPVLQRYYTVYDWGNLAVGFGLSKRGPSSSPNTTLMAVKDKSMVIEV
eukprot:gnl/TRDRNA2_/TRDRNA2_174642_c2_seq1.p1 gnl/TRDRNA2_/TRDRNA2_174642_c2~~gnl/TRDRNA2_/TRDRNA2_174642_c2_seq1.p1  ORF type:complete len:432 (+),score=68.04 gnl/TRDRNA2_/TRDRNA2_174642_c2_seq1:122-1417(+)